MPALYPGSEHYHTELCIVGSGGRYRLYSACSVYQYKRAESPQWTAAVQNPKNRPLRAKVLQNLLSFLSMNEIKSLIIDFWHATNSMPVFFTDEVTMEEVGQNPQLRAVEVIIIVVVLIMWAGESDLLLSACRTFRLTANITIMDG